MRTLFLTFLILSQIALNAAKESTFRHRVINNSDGLSNGAVTCIYKDHTGYMWFGTWDGLNRYDGSNITVFSPDAFEEGSISNNIIRNIFEDGNKRLWIVSEDGLNRYNRDKENFNKYLTGLNSKAFIENRFKTTLFEDSIVACAVYNHGLFLFDGSTFKNISADSVSLNNIAGISFFNHKVYILHDDQTLSICKYRENRIELLKKIMINEGVPINCNFNHFFIYREELWLATLSKTNELLLIKPESGQSFIIRHNNDFLVTAVSGISEKGEMLIGTDAGRVFSIDLNNNATLSDISYLFPETTNPAVKIWCIDNKNLDITWLGTDGYGVMEYFFSGKDFRNISKGETKKGQLNHNIIRAIVENNRGDIYAGTRGAGLNCLKKQNGNAVIYDKSNGLSDNAVLSLAEDKYNNIWIGVDGEGIDMLDNKTNSIHHFPLEFRHKQAPEFGHVYSICIDFYGDIWLGTSGNGIVKLKVRQLKNGDYQLDQWQQILSSENGLQSDIVYSIVEAEPNVLWIGTRGGGVQRYNTLTGNFEIFRALDNQESIPNDDVLTLFMASTQKLWVGSSGGLTLIDQSYTPYKFVHYNRINGLPSNTVHAIQQDEKGNLWVSTNDGLSRLKPETGEFWNFNNSDGLINYEYCDNSSCRGQFTGDLYFGGTNGIDVFNPSKIKLSVNNPPLVFTGFYLNQQKQSIGGILNQNIDLTDTIILDYNQNFFGFSFTSLNYHNKSKAEYAYKLDDFNKDWVTLKDNSPALFTNVLHGEYTFNIRWTNEDKSWSNEVRTIKIVVNPPWWQTWWAYFLYLMIFLLLTSLAIGLIIARHKVKTNIKIKEIELSTARKLHQYKLQFFTNIAHEFRTPLTLIMAPAIHLLNKNSADPQTIPFLKSIQENSRRLMHLIGELTEFRKVESNIKCLQIAEHDVFKFAQHIYETFLYYAESHKILLHLDLEGNNPLGWIDNNVIEKIMVNLISNAIKFTPAEGNIHIKIKRTVNDRLFIEVKDTGSGFPEHLQSRIFDRFFFGSNQQGSHKSSMGSGVGLALTKSLVQLHKGTISVNSQIHKGSTFIIEIPVNENDYAESEKASVSPLISDHLEQNISDEFVASEKFFATDVISTTPDAENTKILIVDDNPDIRQLVIQLMGGEYRFIEAENGRIALNLIREHNIDLVISDVLMPELDGMELCKSIKEGFDTCHIPVILLTAKGNLENRIDGINLGADSFIPKPFDPRHLKARINQLIEVREKIRSQIKESPEDSGHKIQGLNSKDARFMKKLQQYINDNLGNPELDADMMKEYLGLSKTLLYTKIKALTTFAPHGYIKHCRLKKAGQLLLHTDANVSEIIYEVGFNNRTYFYRAFKEMYECSPRDYQARNSS